MWMVISPVLVARASDATRKRVKTPDGTWHSNGRAGKERVHDERSGATKSEYKLQLFSPTENKSIFRRQILVLEERKRSRSDLAEVAGAFSPLIIGWPITSVERPLDLINIVYFTTNSTFFTTFEEEQEQNEGHQKQFPGVPCKEFGHVSRSLGHRWRGTIRISLHMDDPLSDAGVTVAPFCLDTQLVNAVCRKLEP